MFDFGNTPIEHDTLLKAQYNCGGDAPVSYYGQWAKITLNDGTTLEATSEAGLNALLTSTTTATVAGSTVSVADIKSIEFGTAVTALPTRTCQLDSWSSLKTVKGFHEGLKTIGDYCFTVANGGGWGSLSGNTVILPSTLTSVGQLFLCACGDPNLTVVVNCPVTVFSATNPNYLLSTYEPDNPQYVNGVKIGGRYAAEFIAKYPNRSTAPYRNLYNGNTLDDFGNALESGAIEDLYPAGTEISDLWNGVENPLIVGTFSGFAKDGKYQKAVGLTRKYVMPTAHEWNNTTTVDYGNSTILKYLNSDYYNACSDKLRGIMSQVEATILNTGGNLRQVSRYVHLFSGIEMCASFNSGEGKPWELWQQRTGLYSGYVDNNNSGRVLIASDGTAIRSWTRSLGTSSTTVCAVSTGGSVTGANNPTQQYGVLPQFWVKYGKEIDLDLDSLKDALDNGTAEDYPTGVEIPDTWNGEDNPLIVGTHRVIIGTDGKKYNAIGLLRKYVEPISQQFNTSSSNASYQGSAILNYLNSTYLNACSDTLKSMISEVSVKWDNGSNLIDVSGKWHLFSGIEVMGTHNDGEGEVWEYWEERTQLSSADNSSNDGRIKQDRSGKAQIWWTRSRASSTGVWRVGTGGGAGNSDTPNTSNGVLPFCYILSSIGYWTVAFNADGGLPEPQEQLVIDGEYATEPEAPTKSNADFLGWYDGENEFDIATTPITKNTNLTAKWHMNLPTSLSEIKSWLNAGLDIPIGTEIPDTWNGKSSPLIVGTNTTINGKKAVGLLRKQIDVNYRWGWSTAQYATSTILNYLYGDYLNNCSEELKPLLANYSARWYYNSTYGYQNTSAKWHLFSASEVMATGSNYSEGTAWEYWKNMTGLASASNAANNGRIVRNTSGAATIWWLRSNIGNVNGQYQVSATGAVSSTSNVSTEYGLLPFCFITAD